MALRALHSAATGMEAMMLSLDVTANNMANAGTTGFKRSRVNFEDLYYEHLKLPGAQDSQSKLTPTGVAVGAGTRVASTDLDFRVGSLLETGQELDVAIAGDGFFRVQDGQEILYTRAGAFTQNDAGELVMNSADRGRLIDPPITIPQGSTDISISSEGLVFARVPGQTDLSQLGQIQTAKFVNAKGLLQVGENLYAQTPASGAPQEGNPGIDGRGPLRQNFLEASNVEPVRELIGLIKTQRNVELNSQVVQASDQLLQLIANLRRV